MKSVGEAAAFVLVAATLSSVLVVADHKILRSLPKPVGPVILGVVGVAGFAMARSAGYENLALPILTAGASAAATALVDRFTGPSATAAVKPAVNGLPSYTIPGLGEYSLYSGEVPGHFKG